jgi:4-hydroxy-tetrahydrodipicolinate synthase
MKFHGSYVALVTPFNEDGSIDFGKLKELTQWHL